MCEDMVDGSVSGSTRIGVGVSESTLGGSTTPWECSQG